jgi:hypothetical protein
MIKVEISLERYFHAFKILKITRLARILKIFQKTYQLMLFALNNFSKIFGKFSVVKIFYKKFPKKIEKM